MKRQRVSKFAHPPGLRILKAAGVIVGVLFLATSFGARSAGQEKAQKPLTKNNIIELLEGDVAPARVANVARSRGIAFEMTRETEGELRDAGADDELVKTLQQLAPKPPAQPSSPAPTAPPVLLIAAIPGGAQVYIDDEPKATTSPEGRVRFSEIPAGEHMVRLSHTGYQDFEQKVELKPGETSTVTAALEAAKPVAPAASVNPPAGPYSGPASPAGSAPSHSPQPPSLGVNVGPYEGPSGQKGAYILGVASDSPAAHAGLRSGYAILAVDNQPITGPPDLVGILGAHRIGDTLMVTYTPSPASGTPVLSTQVLLSTSNAISPGLKNLKTFLVAHDHGFPAGQNLCVGWMTVGNGSVHFQGLRGMTQGRQGGPTHNFEIPLGEIRESKKNAVYLAAMGGFHIKLKKGTNENFFVINAQGQYQPPDALLSALDDAISANSRPSAF